MKIVKQKKLKAIRLIQLKNIAFNFQYFWRFTFVFVHFISINVRFIFRKRISLPSIHNDRLKWHVRFAVCRTHHLRKYIQLFKFYFLIVWKECSLFA